MPVLRSLALGAGTKAFRKRCSLPFIFQFLEQFEACFAIWKVASSFDSIARNNGQVSPDLLANWPEKGIFQIPQVFLGFENLPVQVRAVLRSSKRIGMILLRLFGSRSKLNQP